DDRLALGEETFEPRVPADHELLTLVGGEMPVILGTGVTEKQQVGGGGGGGGHGEAGWVPWIRRMAAGKRTESGKKSGSGVRTGVLRSLRPMNAPLRAPTKTQNGEIPMPKYVDGFVIPMPRKKLAAYRKMAAGAKKIWSD